MDIEKAKEVLKNMDINYRGAAICICKECCFENDRKCFDDINGDCQMNAIETVLNELDKKDEIINEMADAIYLLDAMSEYGNSIKENIEIFTKKVDGK